MLLTNKQKCELYVKTARVLRYRFFYLLYARDKHHSRIYPHLRWCVSFVFYFFFILYFTSESEFRSVSSLPERKTYIATLCLEFTRNRTYYLLYGCKTFEFKLWVYELNSHQRREVNSLFYIWSIFTWRWVCPSERPVQNWGLLFTHIIYGRFNFISLYIYYLRFNILSVTSFILNHICCWK